MGLSVHDPFVDPLGNPLGLARGLPTPKPVKKLKPAIYYFSDPGPGSMTIDPAEYSFFRVFIVGGGGCGRGASAGASRMTGSGGGSSISDILPITEAVKIDYTVGAGATTYIARAGSSTASFLATSMVATGGSYDTNAGLGTGGLRNFRGGRGATGSSARPGGGGGVSADGDDGTTPTSSTGGGSGSGAGADERGVTLKLNRDTDLVGSSSPDGLIGGKGGGGGNLAISDGNQDGGVGIVRIELW